MFLSRSDFSCIFINPQLYRSLALPYQQRNRVRTIRFVLPQGYTQSSETSKLPKLTCALPDVLVLT